MVIAMSRTIVGTPDSVKGKTVTEFKTSPRIRMKSLPRTRQNFAFPKTGYLPIFDKYHLKGAILWFLRDAHRYYVKGSISEHDLRLIAHNIKAKCKVLKVPIPDNFDLQLQPDTFVMS